MKLLKCQNLCCTYKIDTYESESIVYNNTKNKKAGCFIYDPISEKILLVQSRGQLWGSPKGTLQENETTLECALREVKEETGLDIDEKDLIDMMTLNSRVSYFFVKLKEIEVSIQSQITDNDANGIGWFNVNCLYSLVKNGTININQQCRILVKKIFNLDIPYNKKSLTI
jgi:ADP-ribose pyrophosphatase YjhB (NUDIX family)